MVLIYSVLLPEKILSQSQLFFVIIHSFSNLPSTNVELYCKENVQEKERVSVSHGVLQFSSRFMQRLCMHLFVLLSSCECRHLINHRKASDPWKKKKKNTTSAPPAASGCPWLGTKG